ncbi:MAG: DUF359 domain-containing protein [Candidatus Aenigmarchaeota archaeon]|nr:DUF359 domain-containing protein [Candidatus Aenigmarchaeota archaeon]
MYKLPKRMRKELRRPLGRVFANTRSLLAYLKRTKYTKLIAVGDVCSKELIINGVMPDVAVIDRKTRRKKMHWGVKFSGAKTRVKNKPSTISSELVAAVKESMKKRTLIDVRGEEDLAVLPAIKYCTANSLVVYGLWFRGVVAVKADKKMKNKIEGILERMVNEN